MEMTLVISITLPFSETVFPYNQTDDLPEQGHVLGVSKHVLFFTYGGGGFLNCHVKSGLQ